MYKYYNANPLGAMFMIAQSVQFPSLHSALGMKLIEN